MESGIPIDAIIESIYHNFYSETDWQIIKNQITPDKKAAKKLINKAGKFGDSYTQSLLRERYDDLLHDSPIINKDIPTREELLARLNRLMDAYR